MSCHSIQESEPTVNRFRRGEIREDGKIFWAYKSNRAKSECWYSAEQFEAHKEAHRRREQRRVRSPEAKARHRAAQKRWKKRNPECGRERKRERQKHRRATDPTYALRGRMRNRIQDALKSKGLWKRVGTTSIIGCSWKELREYVESLFSPEMTWNNRGQWHIDHIVPLALAKTEQDVIELNHYSNLRPMWKHDNLRKHDTPPSREEAPPQLWRFLPPSST